MLENAVPSSPSCPSIRRWLRGPPLGAGSFGRVSLALNLDDGSLFAVKSAPCSASSQLLSLQNELHLLHSLNSPRIICCLGADIALCENSPCLNLFLEYMKDGSLADLLKTRGPLDETHVRVYTRAILEGLCYLHNQGIVHSDIKGQNILLGDHGEIKIADFGAAKRVKSSSENCQNGNMWGTPLWMAPEVLQGVEQGTPSDIWSLGCTVVEMLQGRPPWGSLKEHTSTNDLASLLFKIAFTYESLPSLVDSLLSPEAKDFLNKCLQRDPKERWTAEQLLRHPFVMIKEQGLWNYASQASPRGTLDFYDESDAESELESPRHSQVPCMSCVNAIEVNCEVHCDGRQQRKVVFYENIMEQHGPIWVTVRHMESWSDERQQPFFGAGEVNLRKASEVKLDSLGFLANRARAVVR